MQTTSLQTRIHAPLLIHGVLNGFIPVPVDNVLLDMILVLTAVAAVETGEFTGLVALVLEMTLQVVLVFVVFSTLIADIDSQRLVSDQRIQLLTEKALHVLRQVAVVERHGGGVVA